MQRSILNILRDFRFSHPHAQPGLHITSFVIASPDARKILDKTCLVGKGWWSQYWWKDAVASGLMHIGNHSWDHNHDTLPEQMSLGAKHGTFKSIDRVELADAEIKVAAEFLRAQVPNPGVSLFSYPYGESNDFLVQTYFPQHAGQLGALAAFSERPGLVTAESDRWNLPRFMFERDWKSPDEFRGLLAAL